MKKKSDSSAATGVSTAAGAAAGVVVGNVLATEVNAAELKDGIETLYDEVESGVSGVYSDLKDRLNGDNEDNAENTPIEEQPADETEVVTEVEVVDTPIQVVYEGETEDPVQNVAATDVVDVEDEEIPDVNVLAYATVQVDDENRVDVAVVNVEGENYYLADIDGDGVADYGAVDVDGDMQLDDDEFVDLSGSGISMKEFQAEIMSDDLYADNNALEGGDDYVNDADVDEFIL